MVVNVETKYSINDVIVSKQNNRYTIGLVTGVTIDATSDEQHGGTKTVYQYMVSFNKNCTPTVVTDEYILFKLCDTTIERIQSIRDDLGWYNKS